MIKMKKTKKSTMLFFFIGCALLSMPSYAQIYAYGIALDSIKESVTSNPADYLLLHQKTIYPDSTLTIDDYFYLYYGSAYLDGYSPYSEGNNLNEIYDFLKTGNYKEAIDICKKQIIEHPGYLKPFFLLGIAYENLDDTLTASKFFKRYYDYLSIPYFSGDGTSTESALWSEVLAMNILLLTNLILNRNHNPLSLRKTCLTICCR
jgi:tetratricopeptide (TPR) repeat protein